MSSAPSDKARYTLSDYQQWEGDWELWDGAAVAMTPSPFGIHGHLLARLATALSIAIDEADAPASVLLEIDWIVSRQTVVRPDLSVVSGGPPQGHIEIPPVLIAEILSTSTREKDLTQKRRLFEQHGVGWYLIVDPDEQALQALRLGEDGVYRELSTPDHLEINLGDNCLISVRLDRLFR